VRTHARHNPTLRHNATSCNTLRLFTCARARTRVTNTFSLPQTHTATQCNTLQHTAIVHVRARTHAREKRCLCECFSLCVYVFCVRQLRSHDAGVFVAVCCSVLQCVAACCSVLKFVVHNNCDHTMLLCLLQCVEVYCSVLQCVAVCCSVLLEFLIRHMMLGCLLQCVVVCCSVSQCIAVCCSVLQRVIVCCSVLQCVAVCYSVLQCVAVCCGIFPFR